MYIMIPMSWVLRAFQHHYKRVVTLGMARLRVVFQEQFDSKIRLSYPT